MAHLGKEFLKCPMKLLKLGFQTVQVQLKAQLEVSILMQVSAIKFMGQALM